MFDFLGSVFGYLLWFFFDAVSNYALAILLFVVVINIFILPFTIKRQKNMPKTARFNAKQQEIRKKYEKDQKKCNEELAKLYEQEGNPMSGCFTTMLLPMVILMGVYGAISKPLQNTLHIPNEKITSAVQFVPTIPSMEGKFAKGYEELQIIRHFPEIKEHLTMFNEEELADIEEYSSGFNFCGIDLLTNPNRAGFKEFLWVIPVLCFLASLLTSILTQKLNGDQTQAAVGCMKFTPYLMPLFFAWMAYTVPGAVGLYWVINTLISGAQMLILNKFYNEKTINAKEEAARLALIELKESSVKEIK